MLASPTYVYLCVLLLDILHGWDYWPPVRKHFEVPVWYLSCTDSSSVGNFVSFPVLTYGEIQHNGARSFSWIALKYATVLSAEPTWVHRWGIHTPSRKDEAFSLRIFYFRLESKMVWEVLCKECEMPSRDLPFRRYDASSSSLDLPWAVKTTRLYLAD